jgi:ubiquinone/menaquinone biosynthesis C-methylase UbiE
VGGVTESGFFYDLFMAPLEKGALGRLRSWVLPLAEGRVLEVGAGTGANLQHLAAGRVSELVVSDPSLNTGRILRKARFSGGGGPQMSCVSAGVEDLPFPDGAFDCVVSTLVFCTVPDPEAGLREIRRVLKPGGSFLFIEHVLPRRRGTAALFRFFAPAWSAFASGCRLDRRTVDIIAAAGFEIRELRYAGGDVFAAGRAVRA